MKVSNTRKINKNSGFTLIELVVVLAGLAALSSFSIPGVLNAIKLNRIEEAKAIMNGYAADCLGKFRISTDPVEFTEKAAPDQLDEIKLNNLGYRIDGNQNKCAKLAIKPSNEKDKSLYPFDFTVTSEGKVIKTATTPGNLSFLNSCRGWAGKNCGLSAEQKAEIARLAAIAKEKAKCDNSYSNKLKAKFSGKTKKWDKNREKCDKEVWVWQGSPVNSEQAWYQAREAKFGEACDKWIAKNRKNRLISKNGKPQTIKECGGENYWFHSGDAFKSQIKWDAANLTYQENLCKKDLVNAKKKKKKGEFIPRPTTGPDPCGEPVWLCDSKTYSTLEAYKNTKCGKPKPKKSTKKKSTKKKGKTPSRCKSFKPHRSCGVFIKKTSPLCKCK